MIVVEVASDSIAHDQSGQPVAVSISVLRVMWL